MPNEVQHIQWALHNFDVLKYLLEKETFCDWAATVGFYIAVHVVDGMLFSQEEHPMRKHGFDHQRRQNILKRTSRYQPLYKHYRRLREASEVARYLEDKQGKATFFQRFMPFDKVLNNLIGTDLKILIEQACTFLNKGSQTDLQNAIQTLFTSTSN